MLQIELDNAGHAFRPGTILRGSVAWHHEKPAKEITVTLAWYTEGKGDEDGDVVIEKSWNPNVERGSEKFEWPIPRGPISRTGNLVRIRWRMEALSSKPDESTTREIVVSHLGRPISSNSH